MEGEVTRFDGVRYLEGALGHAVASTVFIVAGYLFLAFQIQDVGVVCFVVAFGVSANGLSIYGWDRLRSYFEARAARTDDGPDRALTPHSPSPEFRAEVFSGFVLVAGLVVGLVLLNAAFRVFDPRAVGHALVGLLAVGNVAAFLAAFLREFLSSGSGE